MGNRAQRSNDSDRSGDRRQGTGLRKQDQTPHSQRVNYTPGWIARSIYVCLKMYTPREDPPPPNAPVLEYLDNDNNVLTMDINRLEAMIETLCSPPDDTFRNRQILPLRFQITDNIVGAMFKFPYGVNVAVKDTCLAVTTLQLMFEAVQARWVRESFATLKRFASAIPSDLENLIGEYLAPEEPKMYVYGHGPGEITIGLVQFKPFEFKGRMKYMSLQPGHLRSSGDVIPPRIFIKDHPTVHFHPGTSFPMAKRVFDIYNDAS